MSFTAPSVIKKHGGRFAIILKKGRSLFQVVELDSQRLVVRGHSEPDLIKKGYQATDINVYTTAEKFLKHQAGLTANASTALAELADDAFLQ